MTRLRKFLRIKFLFIVLLSAFVLPTSCQNQANKVESNTVKKDSSICKKLPDTLKLVSNYDALARFMAGMQIADTSSVYKYSRCSQWKKYSLRSDSVWKAFYDRSLNKVSAWAKKEIPDAHKTQKTLFYPFSGPDFLYSSHFFPDAETIYMFGLERVGLLPDAQVFYKDSVKSFPRIDVAIYEFLRVTFFHTINMAKDLNTETFHGTLPILMLFAVRTNNTLVNVRPVVINKEGKIEYVKEFKLLYGDERFNQGAELTLFDNKTGVLKKLYYFSVDLSNEGLTGPDPEMKKFLDNLDTTIVTYVKSASYLMHKDHFSIMRNAVLKKSRMILQDDSGIRYKFFDQSIWNINLYGKYVSTIPLFKGYLEQELVKAYKEKNPKPIDFKIGYSTESSNMLLAKRK